MQRERMASVRSQEDAKLIDRDEPDRAFSRESSMRQLEIICIRFLRRSVIMPRSFGYGVVRDLCGHGIGKHLHEDPEIPNFSTVAARYQVEDRV